jgi:hypothetical protein
MSEAFKVGDHVRPAWRGLGSPTVEITSITRDGYNVRRYGQTGGGSFITSAAMETGYEVAPWPRGYPPTFADSKTGESIIADIRRGVQARKARTLYEPKPFGIGDWVTVYHDGSEHVGQVWSDNFVVILTDAGNVALPFYRRRGAYQVNARTVRRAGSPFEQLALAS